MAYSIAVKWLYMWKKEIMKTLVIYAHSNEEQGSIANKTIIKKLKTEKDLKIRSLYSIYPDYNIDIQAEQQALLDADIIVFQYPFHWYSVPGLLKEWLDKVLLYGFAYGAGGDKLHGKELIISTTVGGGSETYQSTGNNHFTINELLTPLQQTASFTGMTFNKPLVTHNMVYIPNGPIKKDSIIKRAEEHADKLLNRLAILKLNH